MSTAICGLVFMLTGGMIFGGSPCASDTVEVSQPHHVVEAKSKRLEQSSIGNTEITGTVNPRGDAASRSPASSAERSALAARARFAEMRAVMERTMVLGEDVPRANLEILQSHMKLLQSDLDAIQAKSRSSAAAPAGASLAMAKQWYQDGLKIINPPAEGVLELPLPMGVNRKADAIAVALDQTVEKSIADASMARAEQVVQKRRQHRSKGPETPSPSVDQQSMF